MSRAIEWGLRARPYVRSHPLVWWPLWMIVGVVGLPIFGAILAIAAVLDGIVHAGRSFAKYVVWAYCAWFVLVRQSPSWRRS